MTRMSVVLLFLISVGSGCTSDPLGLRTSYRDRVVPPQGIAQPVSNPPIAGAPGGQLGQPVGLSQTVILPQTALYNMAIAQAQRGGWNNSYPMLASAGGQIDGRQYPFLTREARIPGPGGARVHKNLVRNTVIAGGLGASPMEDLKYRGGRTIRDVKFMNVYVGGKKMWDANDVQNIDKSLAAAMSDQKLNNVISQYFNNSPVSSQFQGSFFMESWRPKRVEKNDLETQVQALYQGSAFSGRDLPNTVVNFILPRGTVLGDPSAGQQKVTTLSKAIPLADETDSTGGLGGYHGSAHINGQTVYYAVGVYSERLPNGTTNGIPVFDQNWKNVVGTFYHELQEARTDPDVDDAATSPNGMSVLGWTSDSGQEIGDYPIAEAKQLLQVFQEVPLADGSGTVPIQLQYSNFVHGPEGPIDYPHGMEPAPGTDPPKTNPPPKQPNRPSNGIPSNLPQEFQNWDQVEDYIKKAILKLLS